MRVSTAETVAPHAWRELVDVAPLRRADGPVGGRLLEHLVRGPDAVIEIRDGDALALLAAVVDTCTTHSDTATLEVVAGDPSRLPDRTVDALFDAAEGVAAAGPRHLLEVPLAEPLADWEPVLHERTYRPAWSVHEFKRDAQPSDARGGATPPPGWRWRELGPADAESYHRLLVRSLARVPGAYVPSTAELRRWLASTRARPEVLVCEVDRLVGWVFVTTGPAGGVVRSLGRDPSVAGRRMGDLLMRRGLSRLARRGVGTVRLEASDDNEPALALYARHGFETLRSSPVFRRTLGG